MPCADAKRKCDRQQPECQRCLDRDVDCRYPQPKRRRRDDASRLAHPGPSPVSMLHAYADAPALDIGEWAAVGAGLDVPLLHDIVMPYDLVTPTGTSLPTPPPPLPLSVSPPQELLPGSASGAASPWFLREDTWVKQHRESPKVHRADIEMEPFILAVREMLQSWVRDGHNSFIHQRLYEDGMTPCLQDAFAVVAAYTSCTLAVKDTILKIVADHSRALASQGLPMAPAGGAAAAVRTHLMHLHALFAYVFIGLFDGSVRARTAAERQIPTLRHWVALLWSVMEQYRDEHRRSPSHHPPAPSPATGAFDLDYYEGATELWRLWILTESVRRSLIIIETVANLYECMIQEWAECTGAVMFTARRGLWEARSATAWLEKTRAETPLLVSTLCPEAFIAQNAAEDVDGFAKVLWACAVGSDRMQCWIDGK